MTEFEEKVLSLLDQVVSLLGEHQPKIYSSVEDDPESRLWSKRTIISHEAKANLDELRVAWRYRYDLSPVVIKGSPDQIMERFALSKEEFEAFYE